MTVPDSFGAWESAKSLNYCRKVEVTLRWRTVLLP